MTTGYPAWEAAYAAFAAARRAEMSFDQEAYYPSCDAGTVTADMEDESDRLTNVRCDLADIVCDVPAQTAEHLATKILIAFDNGREATQLLPLILRDCRRFADDELTRGAASEGVA